MHEETFGTLRARVAGGPDREGGGDGPVVVLCHGFGAPGDDLAQLWRVLDVPRETRFVFPVGPLALGELIPGFGEARAWWMVDVAAVEAQLAAGEPRDLTGGLPEGTPAARAQLETLLDEVQDRMGVGGERLVLGGFSQGAMLCCDLALRSERPLAGLVLLSGTLLAEAEWVPLMPRRRGLRVLQSHGVQDPLLSFPIAERLRDHLLAAGLPVEWIRFHGGHEIPQSAIERLGAFITEVTTSSASGE
jgi:phospholipase/carboxylesterase